ncbi:MAG: proline--tRNA ligase [Candidatus Omnitrophica bacterium CG12_big_fil_rev_8_21_14_0_65_43_15]|uniref:Proline--tRNA ligase n=1 Tax=Candidatus Taenaricola geysiri TaxID=1974752 RepID=A0A2J0LEQ0_9BACT|nr:MAG: proline--tRNA ligase [Candidatus Omnitrophica bacterium CG1_02_43_210]PIV12477.1 MAG: proline--tRNA ligase [Candidatus Omnitrophica bacterium CG03_land_8_20_14_0_80_43_22]PIW66335.1 MAG: proline--tRNA ligase [Candidatus Omnitrophica bacterium CG12_big_fil_rev_8_21_14_0_65_43_15]PJC46650.1 MAG: proline--tRNA ligase [Candidatus Omnitrophica bacterium CG_4_9_14_0_2_um_filter_43_12]
MKWTQSYIPTLRETPADAEAISHILMLRSGMIKKVISGAYSYLPLGFKVLNKVIDIVRSEMNAAGAQELLMPAIQPAEIWKESGRYDVIKDIMISYKDRHGSEMIMGPTHEEIIVDIVRKDISSYKQLPFILYQIQTKFRDEPRPRFGIIRSKEFLMKDAYSFDKDTDGLNRNYEKMYNAYISIFKKCGLNAIPVEAESGIMGGDTSHEFMVLSESGEDEITHKGKKEKAIEIGHVFKLGTKYSKALGANFSDENGKENPIIMGCYGIGINRILAAAIEENHDKEGIIWPKAIAPYQVIVIPTNTADEKINKAANDIYDKLIKEGVEVIIDDRDERAGVKFKDADLIGVPTHVIIGKGLTDGKIEIKDRKTKETQQVLVKDVIKAI